MSRIVVTGGAGFIGSHVVELFAKDRHEVTVIDDLSSGLMGNVSKEIPVLKLDIRSGEARKAITEIQPDVIVHAAAQISVRISMEDPAADADVNVVGLLNLLQGMKPGKLPFFVFISTGGAIYGEQDSFPADEDHPIRPTSAYGLAKRVGEMYLDLFARESSLKFASLRLANVYGPRQNPHGEAGVVAIFLTKLLTGGVPVINGEGAQTRDFVFVRDVARAVQKVATQKIEGIYNIGTGVETSVTKLYKYISASVASTKEASHGPAKVGEQMRSSIDSSRALSTFGWKPEYDIVKGIEETAAWFKDQNKNAAPNGV